MKKLQKLKLNNKAKIMTAPQMKNITGGYNGGGWLDCSPRKGYRCEVHWKNGLFDQVACCGSSADDCECRMEDDFGSECAGVYCFY